MPFFIILFVAGIALLQQQAALPPLVWAAALPPSILFAWMVRTQRWLRFSAIAVCCFTAGFFYAATRAQIRMADALAPEWEGRDIKIVGVVAGLPQQYERSVRFEFDVERVLTPDAHVPTHIALSWWGSAGKDGQRAPQLDIKPGERWQLTVRLRRPRGSANPHGFDYEAWLFERDIRATGAVRPKSGGRRIAAMVHKPAYWIDFTRERLRARILQALPDKPYAGVLVALAIGDQRAIPPDQAADIVIDNWSGNIEVVHHFRCLSRWRDVRQTAHRCTLGMLIIVVRPIFRALHSIRFAERTDKKI